MAQDLEPNNCQDTAVGTLPLGPKGYAVESLSGVVQPPDNMLGTPAEPIRSTDPRDFYRVNYTGGTTSVNVVSLGNWDARQTFDGDEIIELQLKSAVGYLYVQVAYLGEDTFYEYYDNVQRRYLQVDSAAQIKLPVFEVPRGGGSSFLAEISGYRYVGGEAIELNYDITLSFSGSVKPTEFNDELYGDDDIDNTIHLLAGDDTYYGLGGDDTIYGERGNDALDGGKGNDLLDGGAGKDKMLGRAGNDTYRVDDKGDVVDESIQGSGGIDLVNSSVTFTLPDNVENLALIGLSIDGTGNDLNNFITGTTRDNTLSGRGGDDTLDGRSGNDTLNGDGGNDTLIGGAGNDTFDGGAGNDTAVFTKSKASYRFAKLADGSLTVRIESETDTLNSIEKVKFADGVFDAAKLITAGPGKFAPVIMSGKGSAKAAYSLNENDTSVAKLVASDADNSALTWSLSGKDAKLFTINKSGALAFKAAPDFEMPRDTDKNNVYEVTVKVSDGKRSDTQALSVKVKGAEGLVLVGLSSPDTLRGTAEADALKGRHGDDILIGSKGADKLWGGSGKDTFVFEASADSTRDKKGQDTIYDFAKGDRFDLSAIDANSKKGGDQAFAWLGTAKFHGKAGELRYEKKASDTYVSADTNGDKKVDFAFHLDDSVKLVKGDFIL